MLSAAQRTLMTLILQKNPIEAIKHLDANTSMDVNFSVSMKQYQLYGFTPLMMAANFAQEDVVAALLKRNAKVAARDLTGKTALHYAVGATTLTSSRSKIIESLTDANKELLTIADNFGNLPIHIAALNSAHELHELNKPPRTYTPSLARHCLKPQQTQDSIDSCTQSVQKLTNKV